MNTETNKIPATPSSKLTIKVGYSNIIVLEYKAGIKLLEALEKAEIFNDSYAEETKVIKPMEKDFFTVSALSEEDYLKYKTKYILGVSSE